MYRQSCHNQRRWSTVDISSDVLVYNWHLFLPREPFFSVRRAGQKRRSSPAPRWNLPPHDGPHRTNTPHNTPFISILHPFLPLHFTFPFFFFKRAAKNVTFLVAVPSRFSIFASKTGARTRDGTSLSPHSYTSQDRIDFVAQVRLLICRNTHLNE